jgi:tetratricopeptide (TPR) repeat protein
MHQRRVPEVEKAITYFQRAIGLDHGFALAHATLGYSYASLSFLGHTPPNESMPKAKAAYDQALKLDDQLAEAHSFLACYKIHYEWDFIGAKQDHLRAINLDPNSAEVHQEYGFYLTCMRRFDQAIPECRRAEELDPTDMFISRSVAMALFFARRYDEAIEQSRRVVELNPN